MATAAAAVEPDRSETRVLLPGDPAPWFKAPTTTIQSFSFDTVAGRYIALLFYGTANAQATQEALAAVMRRRTLFDDRRICFFGVTVDPADQASGRIAEAIPGIRHFVDTSREVSRLYGRLGAGPNGTSYAASWVVLDPMLRVLFTAPLTATEQVLDHIAGLPDPAASRAPTPVLLVPRVFEPPLCRELIDQFETNGGTESGFMREVDGRTVAIKDHSFKRRSDYSIPEGPFREGLRARLRRRLLPEIEKAFQFKATRIERFIVACYDGASNDFFRAHRDNTTPGTAHRRFAVTLNLNTEEYDGGGLRFPEFGDTEWKAPTGGAIVFSCGLLHEARPVTRGKRYAFLPFLYDEDGAKVREKNQHLVDLAG